MTGHRKVRIGTMKKIKKWLALLMVTVGILSSGTMTAFAYVDESAQTEAVPETEAPVVEETQPQTEATPFSVPGNGQLVDDKTDDDTKQFLTIQTKNGNTFFLVLDRSSNTENVYMLSMIDENDLAEFIGETEIEAETETPQVVIPETETVPAQTEPETEAEPQKENSGMNTGTLLAVFLLLAGGIGAGYYFKVVKPKKEEEEAEGEDLEFYDGGAYINEDQESDSDKDEEE